MWTGAQIEELYRRHGPAVFRRSSALLGESSEAHDVTQEVFLRLLERPPGEAPPNSMAAYLFAAATHECFHRLRRRNLRGEPWQAAVAEHFAASARPPEVGMTLEARQWLQALLADSDEQTTLMALYHFVDGLAQGEIAQLVGLSRVTVNQRLQRFRQLALEKRKEDSP